MKENDKSIPNLSDKTFKLIEIEGKAEIIAKDFYSDEWNDGKEEFGVKKINHLSNTTDDLTNTTNGLTNVTKDLTNTTNGLTSVTKDLTNTTNGLTSVTKEHTNTITELIKKIQQLEEDSKKDHYYEGEYKWMPTTVNSMPKGWKKVSMTDGFTLVSGKNESFTKGEILQHSHRFNNDDYFLGSSRKFSGRLISGGGDTTTLTIHGSIENVLATDSSGNSTGNLAAGIHATLWQYDPNGKFVQLREELTKDIKEQIK